MLAALRSCGLGDAMIPGVHDLTGSDVATLAGELREAGRKVFILPLGIADRESFFRGVRQAVPLDPPVLSDSNWDALSDSIWNGLDSLDESRVAIVWPESQTMAQVAPDDYVVAQEILANITKSLASAKATVGRPKDVIVCLA
jgi:hypothetical protein